VVILIVLLALAVGACTMPPPVEQPTAPAPGPTTGPTPTGRSVITVAITSLPSADPRALDTPDGLLLASQIFDGLVDYDPQTLEAVPAAAERWQVLEGGRLFVFHLRQRMLFHDGSSVRAQDFVTAWNRLADPFRPSPYAFLLERLEGFREYNVTLDQDHISGVVPRDDRTLEVRLTEPWPDFVSLLGHPALSPVPEAAAFPGYTARPVGNGPYQLAAELAPGTPLSLIPFDGYYGSPPGLQVELPVYADPEAAWPDFLAGDLDVSPIPGGLVPEAQAEFGDEGLVTLARLVHCGFNLADPRFRDPRLRRAVALAIDRRALVERVYGPVALAADGIVPPTLPGYGQGACGALCRRDVAAAAALVERLPRRARSFSLDYAASPVGDRLAAALAGQLAEVGLEVTPRAHQEEDYRALLEQEGQRFFCLVSVADYPRQQSLLEPLLSSDSPDNHTGLRDERVDALLRRAEAARGTGERERLYLAAERRALSLAPLVPLAWFRSRLAAGSDVDGLAVNPLGRFDVAALSLRP
jgi:oligopeptide transport system substrate-binding protein